VTPTQWQTLGVIFGVVGVIATVYYLRQSSTREAARVAAQDKKDAIASAERPLKAEIAAHLATNAQLRQDHASALSAQREQFREQLQAVRDTAAAQVVTANRVIERRDDRIRDLEQRVDQLEDELRRGRGHGDNDAQRQPPNG
jgi:chromosome segregation ATPase